MNEDPAKAAAGRAAAELVADGMRLGLGTGSTVRYFLEALAGRRLDVAGVPTSEATATLARELGIELLDPGDVDGLDLAVDGADELDEALVLTKGGGGALLREKVVATMADRFVVIATIDKVVARLGDSFPLPIDVVPFAVGPVMRWLRERGYAVSLRDGGKFVTDNGNLVVDAHCAGGIADPAVEDIALSMLPGVVCSGLFVDLADEVLLGDTDGHVTVRRRTTD